MHELAFRDVARTIGLRCLAGWLRVPEKIRANGKMFKIANLRFAKKQEADLLRHSARYPTIGDACGRLLEHAHGAGGYRIDSGRNNPAMKQVLEEFKERQMYAHMGRPRNVSPKRR